MEQADALLKELNIPTETEIEKKADRLALVGFKNAAPVKQAESLKSYRRQQEFKIVSTKSEAELIKYYQQTYPFNKFLTESELDRICKKYGLIYAPIANYIKDVPEKNLRELENKTNIKAEDVGKDKVVFKYDGSFNSKATPEQKQELKKGIDISNILSGRISDQWNNPVCRKFFGINYDICDWDSIHSEQTTIRMSGSFIAAPKSHFNLKGLNHKSKYGFLNSFTEVKDPIVFRYVRGGIMVDSKWGLEGEDESLVNEKMN